MAISIQFSHNTLQITAKGNTVQDAPKNQISLYVTYVVIICKSGGNLFIRWSKGLAVATPWRDQKLETLFSNPCTVNKH